MCPMSFELSPQVNRAVICLLSNVKSSSVYSVFEPFTWVKVDLAISSACSLVTSEDTFIGTVRSWNVFVFTVTLKVV